MKIFKRTMLACVLVGVGLLGGCAFLTGITNQVVNTVDEYCTRSTYQERQLIRANVNAALAAKGHSIAVTCANDPTVTP